jgi:uncharacterized DUF497 family protein
MPTIETIIWLDEIVEKLARKHDVQELEVCQVLEGRPRFRWLEKGHRPGEDLYLALGRTESGRFLSVFFVYRIDRSALVVSARTMSPAERRGYERK